MSSSSIVIKIKFGNTLRRFSALIHDDELCFNMIMLNEKIRRLFDLAPDADFTLTYIDEDDDVVALLDDNDLCDIAVQSLDPLRITVKLNTNKLNRSNGSSNLQKSVQEQHVHDAICDLLHEFALKESAQPKLELAKLNEQMKTSKNTMGASDIKDQNWSNGEVESLKLKNEDIKGSGGALNRDYLKNCVQDSEKWLQTAKTSDDMGVCCDGCEVNLITGSRFKSKLKDDYDLCSICFEGLGRDDDYNRIDCPSSLFKLDSRFILDVKILDGAIMAPSVKFTKIWRLRNNGYIVWPYGSKLMWTGGNMLGNTFSVQVEIPDSGLPVDQEVNIAVDFTTPNLPGHYVSSWRMFSPSGEQFGEHVWVSIQVDDSMKDSFESEIETFIDLNMPPVDPYEDIMKAIESEDLFFDAESLMNDGTAHVVHPHGSNPDEEQTLLSRLARMGFKDVDYNRVVLKQNKYNFAKSVIDLCGDLEWDQILDI